MSHLKRVQSAQTPRPSPPAARGRGVNNNNNRFNQQQHHHTTDTHSSTLETLETDEDFDSSRPYDRENSRARSATVTATPHPQDDNNDESTSANTARPRDRDRGMTVQPMPVHYSRNNYVDPDAATATTTYADNSTSTGNGNGIDTGYGNEDRMDLADKIVLCITSWNGKIGCCYYDPNERKLFLMEDQVDSVKFDSALNVIDQVNPHLTLVSNRADEGLVDGIKKKLALAGGDFSPTIEIRSNREFQAVQGRTYLLDLPIISGEDEEEEEEGDNGQHHRNANRGNDNGNARRDDTSSDIVNVGQEGLKKAYDFMRMRRRRVGGTKKGHLGRFVNSLKLGGSVTLDSEKSLETVACLFSYLLRKRNAGELSGERQNIDVVSIELISLDKVMSVNTDTLCALQIFEAEDHANVNSNVKKEGLSLYSMLNCTKTGLGKNLLKQWLLRPSREPEVLNDRFNAIECFSRADNIHLSENIQRIITVKNVPRLLKNLIAGNSPVQQWQALAQFLSACISVRDLIGNLMGGKEVAILQKLCDSFEIGLFAELSQMIEDKIDWAESKEHHRVCIMEKIDQRLDDNRRTYHGLPSMLSKIAQHLSKSINPDFCHSLNVIYFPQLGYLCAVPLPDEFPNPIMDRATPPGWQFQFSTELSVYYKNQEMRDLDTHVGDLHGFIVDREVELVQEMLEHVLKVQETLCSVADVLAELDVLLAFADVARMNEWTRPVITESNVIRITGGMHPLVQKCVDHYVPNDAHLVGSRGVSLARFEEIQNKPDAKTLKAATRAAERKELINSAISNGIPRDQAEIMADDFMNNKSGKQQKYTKVKTEDGDIQMVPIENEDEDDDDDDLETETLLSPDDSILILTGANASGKSVFLKSVAILVYMAHIGSFVPAEKAVIGLTDKIMTRVSTRESVSRGTSAFMIDLQQISLMLRNCTERSLLIIDEFGKGTNSVDGAGLFVGLINHLVTLGSNLPKTLLATHFHEIFFNDFLKRGLPIGLAHMELIIDREKPKSHDPGAEGRVISVTPLFKLAPGLCLKSYAFQCAESFGIPTKTVERALEVSSAISSYNVHQIMDPQMTEDDEKELLEAEQIVRRLILTDFQEDYDEHGNHVPAMKKLADILGKPYMPETEEVVAIRRR